MNGIIVREFEKLIDQVRFNIDNSKLDVSKDYFRFKQLNHALNIIKKFKKEIKDANDLKGIKGIGKGTLSRVDEILKTGKLSEIKLKEKDLLKLESVKKLEEVHGIGSKLANKLVNEYGITTVDQLINAYESGLVALNEQVVLGLKYYGIAQRGIPREEMDQIYNFVAKVALDLDPELFVTVSGSYRRLSLVSGDVDFLVVHPKIKTVNDIQIEDSYLVKLVNKLTDIGFLLDSLTRDDFKIEYMGFCRLGENGIVRRIDIQYFPYNCFYAAWLFFTGSDNFNRQMRGLAKSLGFHLNRYGIFRVVNGEKILIPTNSEKEIFDILGMEYLTPDKRV